MNRTTRTSPVFFHLRSTSGRSKPSRGAQRLGVMTAALACAVGLSIAGCAASADGAAAGAATGAYEEIARSYLEWHYANHPGTATRLGVHAYDHELDDWTAAGVVARVAGLRGWGERLDAVPSVELSGTAVLDHEVLRRAIGAELLELERVRTFVRDPRLYTSVVSGGIAGLAERRFAPVAERLESMTSRMSAAPALLETARANLRAEKVPPLWIELAQRNARGLAGFLRTDLVAMLEDQGLAEAPSAVREAWDAARLRTADAVEAYGSWLADDLGPRASGDFRLGAELFMEKLRLEEFVDVDVEALWQMNEDAIERYQAWVAEIAAEIDPSLSPRQVMASVTADHPSAEELLQTAREMLGQARDFIVEREIVTLPSERMPIVRPTPEYSRMGFASMSTPGPFETVATEAYYNITNVDPEWSAEEQEQHLTYFNYPGLLGVTIHEAMPGHFVQLLYEQRIPTEVRRVFTPASLVEGWAHYTEQMMIDEGLGAGDPRIRLGQLRRALQRHARWYAGMALHVRGASVEEAAARFAEIAYFADFPALRETQRGTYNPTYLYYALGRMQILDLRAELEARAAEAGETFSLRDFHDRFLELGLAVPLARRVLLGNEGLE